MVTDANLQWNVAFYHTLIKEVDLIFRMAGEIFLRLCHLMRIEDYFRILNLDSIYIIRDDLPSLLDTIDPFIASFNPRVFPHSSQSGKSSSIQSPYMASLCSASGLYLCVKIKSEVINSSNPFVVGLTKEITLVINNAPNVDSIEWMGFLYHILINGISASTIIPISII